jgi:hypothetical protein
MTNTTEIWLMSLIILTSLVILFVTLQLSSALKRLSQVEGTEEAKKSRSWWDNFTGLRPIEEEKDIAMEHQYDGIIELDNPTPPWFMYLFYLTILFGIIYAVNYHFLQDGNIQDAEITFKEWKKINDTLFVLLGGYCGKDPEQVKEDAQRDLWLDAQEALDYGIIDEIVTKKGGL